MAQNESNTMSLDSLNYVQNHVAASNVYRQGFAHEQRNTESSSGYSRASQFLTRLRKSPSLS